MGTILTGSLANHARQTLFAGFIGIALTEGSIGPTLDADHGKIYSDGP